MRGDRFATQVLAARVRDPFDRAEAERTSMMAERFIAAQGATLRATAGPYVSREPALPLNRTASVLSGISPLATPGGGASR
jgi:hypothetical protein